MNRPGHGGPPPMPPRVYGAHPQHHPEAVFVNANMRDTSITRLTVPLLLVGSLAVFLVVATYMATSQFSDIKYAIDKLSTRVEALSGELASRITRVEQDSSARDREAYTKRDHEVWCAKAERANAAIGWTCGTNGEIAQRYVTPQVTGWTTRAKP